MTTTLLLVRHCEVSNPQQILYGRLPGFALSERGEEQAARLANYLATKPISAIYSSPLLRARQTVQRIAVRHPCAIVHRSTLLHEVLTSWQGEHFANLTGARFYDPPRVSTDESMYAVSGRMRRFVERTTLVHSGETIVAVSHGDPIAIYLMALSGRALSENDLRQNRASYPDLASVNALVFDSAGQCVSRDYLSPSKYALAPI